MMNILERGEPNFYDALIERSVDRDEIKCLHYLTEKEDLEVFAVFLEFSRGAVFRIVLCTLAIIFHLNTYYTFQ